MRFMGLLAIAAALTATSSIAAPLPTPDEIGASGDRALLPELLTLTAQKDRPRPPAEALAGLDSLLAKLDRPTLLRGVALFFKANALSALDRDEEARAAIVESIRLLPEHSGPLLAAVGVFQYSGRPGEAADYLLRASRIDPRLVAAMPDYELAGLLGRLDDTNEEDRHRAVSARMLALGWARGQSTLSAMTMATIRAKLAAGDIDAAKALVTRIALPSHAARLVTEQRYAALRPATLAWAGIRFETLWPVYLREMRAAWEAGRNSEAGRYYSAALVDAGLDQTLIATFRPRFERQIDRVKDFDFIFVVPMLADALARQGRWDEAYDLFDRTLAIWPAGKDANAINLTGNRAQLLHDHGRLEEAAEAFAAVIADAQRWPGQISSDTMATLHFHRACALAQLGRSGADPVSAAVMAGVGRDRAIPYARFRLCDDDLEGARDALIDGLADDKQRADIVAFAQPRSVAPADSDFARQMAARHDRLRTHPMFVRSVQQYGLVRPEPVNAAIRPGAMTR